MNITFAQVWGSSTDLLKRFGLMPTPKKAWSKMDEEIAEFSEALYKLADNRKGIYARRDAAQELADLIVTALNVGYTAGLTGEEIEAALLAVCLKNDQKSDKTHCVENGFIKRITPIAFMESGE